MAWAFCAGSNATAQPVAPSDRADADTDEEPLERGRFGRLVNETARGQESGLLQFHNLQPVLGGLRSGAGTTLGLKYEPLSRDSPFYLSSAARLSRRGYWGIETLVGRDSDPIAYYGIARYRHMPQEDYYGVGPNTPESNHAVFRLDELFVGGLAGAHAGGRVFFGGHFGFLENRVGAGVNSDKDSVDEVYAVEEAPGMFPGVSYLVSGVWVEYDTRDLPPLRGFGSRFSPAQWRLQGLSLDARSGWLASAELRHYTDLDGGDYGFFRLNLESQQYVPLVNRRLIVAARQFGSLSLPEYNDLVPFYMMQSLGGVRSLRGFGNFRFRDLNAALLNAEVRWYALGGVQLALFGDAGHVFHRFSALSAQDLEASFGAGIRFQLGGRTVLRLEAAHSREGTTTYLNVGSFL